MLRVGRRKLLENEIGCERHAMKPAKLGQAPKTTLRRQQMIDRHSNPHGPNGWAWKCVLGCRAARSALVVKSIIAGRFQPRTTSKALIRWSYVEPLRYWPSMFRDSPDSSRRGVQLAGRRSLRGCGHFASARIDTPSIPEHDRARTYAVRLWVDGARGADRETENNQSAWAANRGLEGLGHYRAGS